MENVLIDVLKAIVAHASDQEPASDVLILLKRQRSLTLRATININTRKVAGELTLILCNKSPFGKFFGLCTFDKKTSDFVPTEFKPKHIVGQVQEEVILLGIRFKEFALSHQILSSLFLKVTWVARRMVNYLAANMAAFLGFRAGS